jgi:hypothetical protein
MMSAIEELHGVSVRVEMCPAGALGLGTMEIVVIATRKTEPNGVVPHSVSRKYHWPSRDFVELTALLYNAAHACDLDCGQMWVQESFNPQA